MVGALIYSTLKSSPGHRAFPRTIFKLGVCMGWVEGIFCPNPPWWVKKNSTQSSPLHKSNPTQPNPYGLGWVGLNSWIWQIIIIIIINKLSRKKILI